MTTRSIFSFVTVCSLPLLVLAVGCAAPTSSDEGETSQDLSAASTPTVSTGGARIIDPICREHILRSDACVLDVEWRERATQLCHAEHMKVESFRVLESCGGPTPTPVSGGPTPTPASGGASGSPSSGGTGAAGGGGSASGGGSGSAAGGGSGSAGGGGGSTGGGGGVIPIDPAATRVEVACCNYGVEPLVRPESAPSAVAH